MDMGGNQKHRSISSDPDDNSSKNCKPNTTSKLKLSRECNRDITDKATEFVLLLDHSVHGVYNSALKIFIH